MIGNEGSLNHIPLVKISPEGQFKYILIQARIYENDEQSTLLFVRGQRQLHYHVDNFNKFVYQIGTNGFEVKNKNENRGKCSLVKGEAEVFLQCLGGGRIEHNFLDNKCFIYGYSNRYGTVDHTITKQIISNELRYAQHEIKTSQQGY